MRIRDAAVCALFPLLLTAACGESSPSEPPLAPLPEVLRVEVSGVPDARSWVVYGQQEWRALWDSIPDSELGGRTLPAVDFATGMVVVVTAGTGSSGQPELTFDGYRTVDGTTEIHVQSRMCGRADDVIQRLIAGTVPRSPGPIRVIRHHSIRCED